LQLDSFWTQGEAWRKRIIQSRHSSKLPAWDLNKDSAARVTVCAEIENYMNMITDLRNLQVNLKTVLVRCDFNVPLKNGAIADPARIDASVETIRYLLTHRARVVLCSHLGRPKGHPTPALSLAPVAAYLGKILNCDVPLAPDCVGESVSNMVKKLAAGDAILLENLRFHPGEEANDADFARELARDKHAYVNDAFGTAHRAHASTAGVTVFISQRAAGFLMVRELGALGEFTQRPAHPLVAILGGAKVSDKMGVIRNLMRKIGVDTFLVGGAMAYTFLRARGIPVGRSRIEQDKILLARDLLAEAAEHKIAFLLPVDHIVASAPEPVANVATSDFIPDDQMGLDIGPRTIAEFRARLATAKSVIWNGPLGYFELPAFARGTLQIGETIAKLPGLRSLIGGGDTAAALAGHPWSHCFTHISTGGGATLEYLEGLELPGIRALES
jgi:phosphoglycerate kinase